jgi:hypothetical protein
VGGNEADAVIDAEAVTMEARFQKAFHTLKSCHLRPDLGEFSLG